MNLSHLMNFAVAAVDIKGRLDHPEQSNLCNWSVDQKLTAGTFVTILALNLKQSSKEKKSMIILFDRDIYTLVKL